MRGRVVVAGLASDGPRLPAPAVLPCDDILVPVDKQHALPPDCVPRGLVPLPSGDAILFEDPVLLGRAEAISALLTMFYAARADGISIYARSAYRSYEHQAALFDYWVGLLGFAQAEQTSAMAGHSEHQIGTVFDLATPENGYAFDGFESTATGQWVAANASRFGFILSFPAGMEARTGFAFEPWHVRYVGVPLAATVRASGLTLREFLLAAW